MAKVASKNNQSNDWYLVEEDSKKKGGNPFGGSNERGNAQATQAEASRVNDESSASLKRSLALAHQTNQVGTDTMRELDRQGQQIEGMERDLEKIEDNQKQSERHLRGLKSIFGTLANKFSKNNSYRQESEVVPRATPETVKKAQRDEATASSSQLATKKNSGQKGFSSADLIQGKDEESERMRRQMREQDDDLDELQGALGNMMAIAQDMGKELEDQNKRLDKVSKKADEQNVRMEKNNRQVKKML